MYIIGFNGPPQCGKDTAARLMQEYLDGATDLPVKEESLSLPLRWIAYAMVGRTYTEESYEDFKRESFPQFKRTGRELMIDVSVRFLKGVYGQTIMADLLLARNADFNGILLLRDTGFQSEVDRLSRAMNPKNVCIARVYRPDTTFDNDSRGWVFNYLGSHNTMVSNDGDMDHLHNQVIRLHDFVTGQLGWKF